MIFTYFNTPSNIKPSSTNNWLQKHMYFGLKIPILTNYLNSSTTASDDPINQPTNNIHSKQPASAILITSQIKYNIDINQKIN